MFVCLFVHHTFSLSLTVFVPPLLKVQCPNFLEIWNSLVKKNEKKWSQICTFLLTNGWKAPHRKEFFFFICSLRLNVFLPPTSRSPISKLFQYSESLGKSNVRKWSQIRTFLFKNGLKSLPQKKFLQFFFFCSLYLNIFLSPLPEVQRSNFLDIGNPWGKWWNEVVPYLSPVCRIFLLYILVLLSALVKRCFVSCMRDFFSIRLRVHI